MKNNNLKLSLVILGLTFTVAIFSIYISKSEATISSLIATGTSSILQVGGGAVIGIDSPAYGLLVAGGNVGIGTTTPVKKLEVIGAASIGGNLYGSVNKGPANLPLFRWLPEGTMVATYTVASTSYIFDIAFDGTNMWTANINNSVTKITPTGSMTTYTGISDIPVAIAFDGTNMWTANNNATVSRITPAGGVTSFSSTGNYPIDIAFDGTNMWTANDGSNNITKITPAGVMTTYPYNLGDISAIAFDGTNIWTINYNNHSVYKLDLSGNMLASANISCGIPYKIAFDGTNMWSSGTSYITKITPGLSVTCYNRSDGSDSSGIAFDGTNMWSPNGVNTVSKITPAGSVSGYVLPGAYGDAIAFDGTYMWIVGGPNGVKNTVTKVLVNTR